MKTLIALDKIASKSIPEGKHPLLKVDSRKAWVKVVMELVETGKVEPTTNNLKVLSQNWEPLLITKYSALN
jgi:hypothetical protein